MIDHIFGDQHAFAGFQIYHHKIKPAIAAGFIAGFAEDFEMHPAFFSVDGFNAGFYDKVILIFSGRL